MIKVVHAPHTTRVREARFGDTLVASLPNSFVANGYHRPSAELLDTLIDRDWLIDRLSLDKKLPEKKRCVAINTLQILPSQIRIANDPTRVSCDFVVITPAQEFAIEFHEEQHRNLKDNRDRLVYGPDLRPYTVPRFVQRLIRDVWRILAIPHLTVIWFDWFADIQRSGFTISNMGFQEFGMAGKFSFKEFIGF